MRLKSKNTKRALVLVTVAAALGGGGAALAAAGDPAREAEQFEADVAERLGVSEAELESAYEGAMLDSVRRARREGVISAADAREATEAIQSGDVPPFAPPPLGAPGGPHAFPPFADIASRYLGVSEERLEQRLQDGETLAGIARDEGKAVDGLRDALLADARERLRSEVDAGRLDADDAQEMLTELRSHLGDLLRGRLPEPPGSAAPGDPAPFEGHGGAMLPAPAPSGEEGMALPAPPPGN
jgi:hypothetical protein